jgi:enediyne biosynthesis protein E4
VRPGTLICAPLLLAPFLLAAQIRFEDVTGKAGLEFVVRNDARGQFHQVELMPGGVAAFDYNNDGCTDVFFTNGAALPSLRKTGPEFHNRLFRNNCNLTFTDVSQSARLTGEGYSMAAASGDYDNDGNVDLFVAGVHGNFLYRNLGRGVFEDVTVRAGLAPGRGQKIWSVSAGWFDYDHDGRLDLFVSNYVVWDPLAESACGSPVHRLYCHPDSYKGLSHPLFRNNGDGTFTDVSHSTGVGAWVGKGMGVTFADFDNDGWTDVFVANDSVPHQLFRNRNGKFREMALEAGVAYADHGKPIAGMGCDFRDFDNDGHPDLVVTGMVNDTYLAFRNLGRRLLFEDFTAQSGLARATSQLTGWSMGLFDFDNDGWKDLFVANSHFPQLDHYLGVDSPLANSVFRNAGKARFEDVTPGGGEAFTRRAFFRGTAFADFDRDGKVDVVISALNSPGMLLRNVSASPNHWIALRLVGKQSNRDALGARISVTLPDGTYLHNHATTSVGYGSSSEPLVRFGLGANKRVDRIEIRWPSGIVQRLDDVAGDRLVEVVEQ